MRTFSAPRICGLYAITPPSLEPSMMLARVEHALSGGARLVQLRAKHWPQDQLVDTARALRTMTQRYGAMLFVNDDVYLALAVDADGVHLGQGDATLEGVREIAAQKMRVGVSCYNDLRRAQMAQAAGASYVAFGSVFPSKTKPDAARATLDLLRSARATLSIPIVAIGGIEPCNVASVVEAGADAVAVISGLFDAPNIEAAARSYAQAFPSISISFESTT